MAVSYKKLWKLLIDKDMKKKIFVQRQASAMHQWQSLVKNENITIDVLVDICTALQCDIVELSISESNGGSKNNECI